MYKSWQKQLSSVVLSCLLITQVMQIETVFARWEFFADVFKAVSDENSSGATETENFNTFKSDLPYYDLVAILVTEDIYGESKSYDGLLDIYGDKLGEATLKERILRYARDVEDDLEGTKAMIIEVEKGDTVIKIRDTLEKLYFEGDGTKGEMNELTGVVLIGDIPLPVVNKKGNNIPSMFPYTDFVEKSYIFNPDTQEFEVNDAINTPKVEVWHGVIQPPRQGEEGNELLADFFDKNHLYHIDHPDFAEFDQKLFYADLNYEKKSLNKAVFDRYLNYTENAEELTYKRFTGKWLKELSGDLATSLQDDFGGLMDKKNPSFEELGLEVAPTETQVSDPNGPLAAGTTQNIDLAAMTQAFSDVPDIFTKEMIEKYHVPYNSLFTKFLSTVNDYAENSGRWKNTSAIESKKETVVSLIAKKDLFSREYMKTVNDIFEEKIDEIVEKDLQKTIPIIENVVLSGSVADKLIGVDLGGPPSEKKKIDFKKTFINYSKRPYDNDPTALYIKGVPGELILRADQCSVYRGSLGEKSQLTDMRRTSDSRSIDMTPGKDMSGGLSLPTLGVNTILLTPADADKLTGKQYNYGAKVTSDPQTGFVAVLPGSPAEQHFKDGDVILQINSQKINSSLTVDDFVKGRNVGELLNVLRFRNGKAELAEHVALVDLRQYSAGCDISNRDGEKKKVCSEYAARVPVFSAGGGELVSNPSLQAGPRDCFNFRPYEALMGTPVSMGYDSMSFTEKPIGFAGPDLGYTPGFTQGTWGYSGNANSYFEDLDIFYNEYNNDKNFWVNHDANKDQIPDTFPFLRNIPLYDIMIRFYQAVPGSFTGADFSITLGDLLVHYGRFDGKDNDSDSYDTNGNGKPDPMIWDDKNGNGIMEGYDPKDKKFFPLPLNSGNKYTGEYTGEFTGGDFGVDEADEDKPEFAYPNSWQMFHDEMLTIGQEINFETDLVKFNLKPEIVRWISSVIKHKEPTNYTIMQQSLSSTGKALPIDSPRFVTFILKGTDQDQKVIYPNIFDAKTFVEFTETVHKAETKLNGLAALAGLKKNYSGVLMSVLKGETDMKAKDSVRWNNINIDDKHAYVFETYLDPSKDAFIGEAENGFEAVYLVSDGDNGSFDFGFNGNKPELIDDVEFTATNAKKEAFENAVALAGANVELFMDGNGEFSEEIIAKAVVEDFGSEECSIITCWFQYMLEWLKTTVSFSYGFQFEQACGLTDQYNKSDKDKDFEATDPASALYEAVLAMAKDDNDNGIPDSAEFTSKLSLSTNKNAVTANGSDIVDVTVDSGNPTDSFSIVKLFINNGIGNIVSQNPQPLQGGKAVFKVQSTEDTGDFQVYVETTNRPSNLTSNKANIEATKRGLGFSTFITQFEENKLYTEIGTEMFTITNEDNKEVAKVTEDGKLVVTDSGYEVSVTSGHGEPIKFSVVKKVGGETVASMTLMARGDNNISVMDIVPSDSFEAVDAGPACEKYSSNIYLADGDEIKGLVTQDGRILIDDQLKLSLKTTGDEYPVIQITRLNGDVLFEVLLSPTSRAVMKLSEEEESKDEAWITAAHAKEITSDAISDTDFDGLPDITELIIGSSPLKADTDFDKHNDLDELNSGFHPLKMNEWLFSDVSSSYEFFTSIVDLYMRGILSGYPDGTFKPNSNISREEFVKIDLGAVCKSCANLNKDKQAEILATYTEKGAFPDNNINADLLYCVAEAKNENIVSGYKGGELDGYFLPKNNISRAEAIKVIVGTVGLEYTESDDELWYSGYVLGAQQAGILPKDRFIEVDLFNEDDFATWYGSGGSLIMKPWLEGYISRGEFAYMASYILSEFDCYKDDQDSDGIPDFLEIYRFGTDPKLKDTDVGGIFDLPELVKGTNPVDDPTDDMPEIDVCGILDEKYSDAYGLSDEFSELSDGFYIEGVNGDVSEDIIFEESGADSFSEDSDIEKSILEAFGVMSDGENSDSSESPESSPNSGVELSEEIEIVEFVEYTDELLADGKSIMNANVAVLDKDGVIDADDNESVVKLLITKGSEHIDIPYKQVKVINGVAEIQIISKKVSGVATVRAEILNSDIPPIEKEIYAYPDIPTMIDLVPESYILKAGGVAKTPVKVLLRDQNGNPALNAPYTVKLSEGFEKSSVDSFGEIPVVNFVAPKEAGTVHISATLDLPDDDIFAEGNVSISVRDDISLDLSLNDSGNRISANIVDGKGKVVSDFFGFIEFSVADPSFGSFTTDALQKVMNGKASVGFKSGKVTGIGLVSALLEGFNTATMEIDVLAGVPAQIKLYASDEVLLTNGKNAVEVIAELLDINGNLVKHNSKTPVSLKISDSTSKFGSFSGNVQAKFNQGVTKGTLRGGDISGVVNIIAESAGLIPATLSLPVEKRIWSSDLTDANPNTLFVSLLGDAFGNPQNKDYLGGSLTFSGKVQSVASLLTDPKPAKAAFLVNSNGKITINDPANYYAFVKDGSIKIRNNISEKIVAEIIVNPGVASGINVIEGDITKDLDHGFYLKNVLKDEAITYQEVSDGLSILDNSNEIGVIHQNGEIEVVDNSFSVEYPRQPTDAPFFHMNLMKGINNFADLYFVRNSWPSVKMVESKAQNDAGVYIISKTRDLKFSPSYSSNSTHASYGYIATDPSKPGDIVNAPGFSYSSLESAGDREGIGFTGANKHMLLLAAGNTVGVSNMSYSSEIGIVLGDPTVRLSEDPNTKMYTKDIGQMIFQGDELAQNIIPIDYDSDSDEDLFVVYQDGEVRLLERVQTASKFKDRGVFLNITNGIFSVVSGDFDADNDDDLFVATKESCKQGEVCMYLYRNNGGYFEREAQDFDIDSKMYFLKAGDIDNDSDLDVIGSDTGGKILGFYNNSGKFDPKVQRIGDLGINVDPGVNLSSNVWVHYSEQKLLPPGRTLELILSETGLDVSKDYVETASDFFSDLENVENSTSGGTVGFNLLSQDPVLSTSSFKTIEDVNGGNIEVDDILRTTIVIKNNSGLTLSNVFVSDLGSELFEITKDTLKCAECDSKLNIIRSGMDKRPNVFTGIEIGANSIRTITYDSKVSAVPRVQISLGKNFDGFENDEYLDIQARPENNPTGQIVYFHTNPASLLKPDGQIDYKVYVTKKPEPPVKKPTSQSGSLSADVMAKSQAAIKDRTSDADLDGLPGCWDDLNGAQTEAVKEVLNKQITTAAEGGQLPLTDQINAAVEGAMAALNCSGGCIPMPINYAFLVPGTNSAMQWALTPIPPIPFYAFGLTSWPPLFAFGQMPSFFKMYVSPTLTGSLGMSFCAGPIAPPNSPATWCFSTAIPLASMLGVCDAFDGGGKGKDGNQSAVSVSANVEQSSSSGNTVIQANGAQFGANVPAGDSDEATPFGGSVNLGSYQVSANSSTNVRIPPFPGVIVGWIDRQIENVIDTLADLPDIYLLYPDVRYISKEFKSSMEGLGDMKSSLDFMAALNRFPLVQLEGKEIVLRVPMLTPQEIARVKRDWEMWKLDFEAEMKRASDYFMCGTSDADNSVCEKLFVDGTKMIRAVEKNLEAINKWMKFPKDILTWKNLEAKYVGQIVCYMDVIMRWFGGYIKRQEKRVKDWFKAIEKIKKNMESWQALIDLTLDYETACDECKSDKFSTLELLLKLFVAIPSPPDIPLPKWPDIILDFSKLQLGLKFTLPDLKFRPERIIIPPIPRIRIPDIPLDQMGGLEISLPDLPVIPSPPPIPELPDLPPIPLITLPDLPKPPSIPKLPNIVANFSGVLSKVLQLLCLLKKGFIPTMETSLKTQIETLTQRSVGPLSPIDFASAIDYPEISSSYVDQIKLTTTIDFQLDINAITDMVEKFALIWNATVKKSVDKLNDETKDFTKGINSLTGPKINIGGKESFLQDYEDYFENMRTIIEDFKDENHIDGDHMRLIAELDGYMPSDQLACNLSTSADPDQVPAMKEKLLSLAHVWKENLSVSRMMASTTPMSSKDAMSAIDSAAASAPGGGVSLDPASAGPKVNKGIFILNPDEGINEKLLDYTEELATRSEIVYLDHDNDQDEDIILNIGNNIYLKDNHKKSKKGKHYTKVSSGSTISDIAPTYPSVNMFHSPEVNNKSVDLEFRAAMESGLYGYEFIVNGRHETQIVNMVASKPYEARVYTDGNAKLDSFRRNVFDSGSVHGNAGSLVHALSDSVIVLQFDSESQEEIELSEHSTYQIPDSYVNGVNVEVFDGEVEIIDVSEEIKEQVLQDGMALGFGDRIAVSGGEVVIKYPTGAETLVSAGETFLLEELNGLDTSSSTLTMANGNYYSVMRSFDKQGIRGTNSARTVLAPQVCADKTPPFPVLDSNSVTKLILKEFEINAENSFDPDSEIISYSMDLDGDSKIDMTADPKKPIFKLGPFDAPQTFDAKIIVVDEANNSSTQDIKINITVPDVLLDQDTKEKGFITGAISVAEGDIPVKLVRKRGEGFEIIKTMSASELGEYLTDASGNFRVENLDLEEKLVLKNSDGEMVAELAPEMKLFDGYDYIAYPSTQNPHVPTHVEVSDVWGNVLLKFFFSADPNVDVSVDDRETEYTKDSTNFMDGVHVKDMNPTDLFEIKKIPIVSESFPGGVQIINQTDGGKIAVVSSSGDVYLLDTQAKIKVRKTSEDEPFVFEIYYGDDLIFEVFISSNSSLIKKMPKYEKPVQIPDKILSETAVETVTKQIKADEFSDLPFDHPQFDMIEKLRNLGILEGYETALGLLFKPEQNITRAEFAKIILKILCIVAREEAYLPDSVFSDVFYKSAGDPWYWAILKENFFQTFITGYLGEKNPVTGLPPFKPNNNITRAEAAKIILEALGTIDVIEIPQDVRKLQEGEAWYEPYLRIAINLTPFEKDIELKTGYLLTTEESLTPNHILSRAEFAEMAGRVLDIYNCYDNTDTGDNDKDGIPNNVEIEIGLNPDDPSDAGVDDDKDGLSTLKEIRLGTDPFDPDTDKGGVVDGVEVTQGTNPVDNPADDYLTLKDESDVTDETGDFKEAIYIGLPECNACPCPASIANTADIIPTDVIFAIISNDDNSEIYSKSNEIEILQTPAHVE